MTRVVRPDHEVFKVMVPSQRSNDEWGIKDVWAHNLNEEFSKIRTILERYNYVAMDTEFPGVVARPRTGDFLADYQYQLLRCNVDQLNVIQLGLTFFDKRGELPAGSYHTWQFNFRFDLSREKYASDSIQLLHESGIQFTKHESLGIEHKDFAELVITSGLILSDDVTWLSFHSGYDFGYFLKVLTCLRLPVDEDEFFSLLGMYFPRVYDVKYMAGRCGGLRGGLQEVADHLELTRCGHQHQAGSDSLLTGMAFFSIRSHFLDETILDEGRFSNVLFGLGKTPSDPCHK